MNAVRGEVGVAEQPPGSNDSPRIAQFRQATAGSGVGPWCAYFTSWAAREAGAPLGDTGQGFGRVDDVYAWAQKAGKAIPNGPGVTPQPGDLIVWDEHIGVVESVGSDGTINTIEGNSSDQVSRRTYAPGRARRDRLRPPRLVSPAWRTRRPKRCSSKSSLRERDERAQAADADLPPEERTHERRADKHAYLREKLAERARSEEEG